MKTRVRIKDDKAIVDFLEIHASFACNLSCESCSHYSNQNHKGHVSIEDLEEWTKGWKDKLVPIKLNILGGEPAANPNLSNFLLKTAEIFPKTQLLLTTNGLLLKNHPNLPNVLKEKNIKVKVSVHSLEPEYLEKMRRVEDLLQDWGVEYVMKDSARGWTRRYIGFGSQMTPFTDNDSQKSWEICPAKYCVQLFNGNLFKCSSLAYLHVQHAKYGLNEIWNQYLSHPSLDSSATPQQIKEFYEKEAEECCTMCPAYPRNFIKNPFKKER